MLPPTQNIFLRCNIVFRYLSKYLNGGRFERII